MSLSEIVYRSGRLVHTEMERMRLAGPHTSPPADLLSNGRGSVLAPPHGLDTAFYDRAARAIGAGRLDVLSLRDVQIEPLAWNRDPLTGVEAPLVFGKTLDYRNLALVGDIKYLWEPNRHLHLVTVAQAYYLTHDPEHLETLRKHLTSWLDQCPYPYGPNWCSSLELAIRLINWALVWELIGGIDSRIFNGETGITLRTRWLGSIYQHVIFVWTYLSRYSSANNHLIGELTGVFVACETWPFWTSFERYGKAASEELCREALAQSTSEGVDREQSTCYHRYVAEFMMIAGLVAQAAGREFPAMYWDRLEAMIGFIAAVMDSGGNVPMIGDADDGRVVRFDPRPAFCPFRSLLAVGAAFFSRPDFRAKVGSPDDSVLWLFGENARVSLERLRPPSGQTPQQEFREGGYFILGCDLDCENEVRVVADAGPLGYTNLAAHGHADALSFTLSIAGRPFLIDPGTYAYHTKGRWRDYFRGTSAHNTVRIDNQNQSVITGNFLWGFKASVCVEAWETNRMFDHVAACHDGYLRLDDPVLHRREFMLHKSLEDPVVLMIVDTFECQSVHAIEVFFHFDDACAVWVAKEQNLVAQRDGLSIELSWSRCQGELMLFRGDEELPIGWVSRSLDCKTATTSAVLSCKIFGITSVETRIRCYRNRATASTSPARDYVLDPISRSACRQ